ncbi:MAG: diguanylate cyclase domain-containing protein [Coriobacteriales bacterium]
MKGTKNSLVTLIVLGIVIASLTIGTIAVASFRNVTEENNHEMLLHYCSEGVESLNSRFDKVEELVGTLADCCEARLESAGELRDDVFRAHFIEDLGSVAYSITANNDDVVTSYFRMEPSIAGPTEGFFISRNSAGEKPQYLEPTDLSAYDSSDVQNVGWYWLPVEEGRAVWTDPYVNPRNGVLTVSYSRPLYIGGELVGVVGLDLDFAALSREVGRISVFDSGFAALMDSNGSLVFSGDHELELPAETVGQITAVQDDYVFSSFMDRQQLCVTASHMLSNGMFLVLVVPDAELYGTSNQLTLTVVLVAIGVSALVILVLTGMVNRVISASRTDALTGARNRNAFLERCDELNDAMRSGKHPAFAMVVFDVNGLKAVNDSAGHAAGDKLIANSCKEIAMAFAGVDIYRIGGDEFALFIEKRTAQVAEKLVADFREAMAQKAGTGTLDFAEGYISCGCALYEPEADASCEDTFSRADKSMYEDKERFYAANPQLKRRA